MAESALEFEEIQRLSSIKDPKKQEETKVRSRRVAISKNPDNDNYMDYLMTVQEQRSKEKLQASTDIRYSVKDSYLKYFKRDDQKDEPLEN